MPTHYDVDDTDAPQFVTAPEIKAWVQDVFLNEKSSLFNPDHEHLIDAQIGFLWAYVPNASQGRTVAGTAEMPNPKGNKWQIARQLFQLVQWFGDVPDFIITIDAVIAAGLSDASFCALIEHELYHCGQALDLFGFPKYRKKSGLPVFTMKAHDVEEFVGVVRRYGAGSASANVQSFVDAANRKPLLHGAEISIACGTCLAM